MDDEKKRLIKIKKKINKKRPKFRRFESWRYVRIKNHWRKPRGIDNKMRTKESGWPKSVKVGWGSPSLVKHLHPSGKEEVLVWNTADLEKINRETQVIRIGGSVGSRKKEEIVRKSNEINIKILNPGIQKEIDDEFEELEDEEK